MPLHISSKVTQKNAKQCFRVSKNRCLTTVAMFHHKNSIVKMDARVKTCFCSNNFSRVYIEKSSEPLGIQIFCRNSGGVFVSSVNEASLAAQVGLQIGDQLLEVCGINMRSATYELAACVLHQCGDSITMLVQYNPAKYQELKEMNGMGNILSSKFFFSIFFFVSFFHFCMCMREAAILKILKGTSLE